MITVPWKCPDCGGFNYDNRETTELFVGCCDCGTEVVVYPCVTSRVHRIESDPVEGSRVRPQA